MELNAFVCRAPISSICRTLHPLKLRPSKHTQPLPVPPSPAPAPTFLSNSHGVQSGVSVLGTLLTFHHVVRVCQCRLAPNFPPSEGCVCTAHACQDAFVGRPRLGCFCTRAAVGGAAVSITVQGPCGVLTSSLFEWNCWITRQLFLTF